jgi:hypothetical protein
MRVFLVTMVYAAGKSIHKAAEAPQASPSSPANQRMVHRFSTDSGRYITPTSHHRTGRIAVSANPSTARKSSTASPQKPDERLRKGGADNSEHESRKRQLVTTLGGAPLSERSMTTSSQHQPQVARKSVSKASRAFETQGSSRPQFSIKAARKSISRTSSALPSDAVSASSAEDSSDDDHVSSSSGSSVVSALSTGPRVKGWLHGDHLSSLDARVVSLSPRGTRHRRSRPDPRATTSSAHPGSGTHSQITPWRPRRPPLQSQGIMEGESHEAKADTKDFHVHHEESKSPTPSMVKRIVNRTSKYSSPASQSITSHMSTAGSDSHPKQPETAVLPDTTDTIPAQPLVDAFENVFVYPLYLHRGKHLPFLRRNIRASFRAWCRDLDKRSNLEADTGTVASSHVSLIYEYISHSGVLYTYKTLHPRRECPVCSLFGVFSSWRDLRRHVRWDHEEIECEISFKDHRTTLLVRIKEHRQ